MDRTITLPKDITVEQLIEKLQDLPSRAMKSKFIPCFLVDKFVVGQEGSTLHGEPTYLDYQKEWNWTYLRFE